MLFMNIKLEDQDKIDFYYLLMKDCTNAELFNFLKKRSLNKVDLNTQEAMLYVSGFIEGIRAHYTTLNYLIAEKNMIREMRGSKDDAL